MKASKAFLFVFLIVLSLCLVTTQHTQSQSLGTIYIRSDGSVEGTDKIQRDGNVYTFTANINDPIVVEMDNIVVDGGGYTLQGTGSGNGIRLSSRSNVTIKNTKIKSFTCALGLDSSSGNNISGNIITTWIGISLDSSNDNLICGNNITKTRSGIMLYGPMAGGPTHNVISGNYIANNLWHGIMLHGSSNTIVGNYIANNGNGTHIFSPPFGAASSNNLIYNNSYVNNTRQISIFKGFAVPDSINIWDNGVEGNYWSNYEERYPNATEIDGSGIWDTPYVIDENNQDNYPLVNPVAIPGLPDITPPIISIVSPENTTYALTDVSLNFTVNELTSWIGYSLDGQANVTITDNTILTGLSEGSHTLVVYATDTDGNTGASETIYFTIKSESFPTTWIAAVVVIIALIGAALLVYFRKIRKTTGKAEKQFVSE